ncbi:DUF2860 domain-containing protein [Photobacterium sanctipauli]|uniref:DUF2860 domain-containing protein n=1 Tax=Photobacterium sanctipauli TaxID=1342794 RepID=A0A2T3NYX4_9GAMM|nr:DUF2860 domain-containing protein [Photobacterium sanctipauli]
MRKLRFVKFRLLNLKLLLIGLAACSQAYALDAIPQQDGFSGFVNLGAGITNVESNTLAEISGINLGNKSIDSVFDSPKDKSAGIPVIGLEIAYTFAESRTQIFLGNQLEDYLRFDFSTRAGIRQEIGKAGIIGVSYLQTPLATEVWEDPFVENSDRNSTDRTSNGFRLIWDKMYGTGLELSYSQREIDIDDERSGEFLGLMEEEKNALDRNGDSRRFAIKYTFNVDKGKHIISPQFTFIDQDLDGESMAYDGVALNVNYIYSMGRWHFVSNASIAGLNYDEENPIYDQKADTQRYGASFTAFYGAPFGWKNWLFNTGVVWFEEDSDIKFYDSSVQLLSAGMLYRFK